MIRNSRIRFGTGGWRGILGEDFTLPQAREVVLAWAEWLKEQPGTGRVLVAHDTRFLGDRLAADACAVLASAGLRPVRIVGAVPTPVVTHALARGRGKAGIIFTASHNAAEYQGLKLFDGSGAGATRAALRQIEQRLSMPRDAVAHSVPSTSSRRLNLLDGYVRDLRELIEGFGPREAQPRVHFDAMHGAGAGVLDRVLSELDLSCTSHRAEPDPRFGGGSPDPVLGRLAGLSKALSRGRGLRLGIATDGDADRFAAMDECGRRLSESDSLALLVDFLGRAGWIPRGVAVSAATGSLVERVAAEYGLPLVRRGMGFRNLAEPLLKGSADLAGDECGGLALAGFTPDKDGILAGALLAAYVAQEGRSLSRLLLALRRRHGHTHCARTALPMRREWSSALDRLRDAPPARVAGARVTGIDGCDGLRLEFPNGFLMLRRSGTEPVLRVYAEAASPRELQGRLAAGPRLLVRAGARSGRH